MPKNSRPTSRNDAVNKAPTQAELKRTLPLGDDLGPTIARMRQIVAQTGNALLLAEGPVAPDWQLLDLASEALTYLRDEQRLRQERHEFGIMAAGDDERYAAMNKLGRQAAPLLNRAKKLRATTAAGIYAKALLVRTSKTGAVELAMQLADELIACPGLRQSLWPAGDVA